MSDEAVENLDIPYGYPAAVQLDGFEDVEICEPVLRTYVESVEARGGFTKEEDVPLEIEDESKVQETSPISIHTSWITRIPWRGEYGEVVVYFNSETGKYYKRFVSFGKRSVNVKLRYILRSQNCQEFYGMLGAERKANKALRKLLTIEQWTSYRMTGEFWEKSERSGISYFVRRGRPTLVFRRVKRPAENDKPASSLDALCALCLHPFGYHKRSFAGLMTPTDDVINFVQLIRINEHFLWRKSTQHRLTSIEAGV